MARDYQTKANVGALPDTITATRFGAGEFNSIAVELENAVTTSDQTLAPADGTGEVTDQLAMALAIYGAGGAFYHADTGAVNAYVLTPISPKESPPAYFDGFTVIFEPGTPNTTASTVNVATLGVKDITYADGNPLTGGELSGSCGIKYNLSDDRFELLFSSGGLAGLEIAYVIDASQADQGAASTNPDTFTIFDVAALVGTTKTATCLLIHNPVAGNVTQFDFDTDLDLSSYPNLYFKMSAGAEFAQVTGDESFTIYSPQNLIVNKHQQLTTVDVLYFANSGTVSPHWFGLQCDGVTDDSAALQYAFDSLSDAGGKVQMYSADKCLVDSAISLPRNVSFQGVYNHVGSPGDNSDIPYDELGGALLINSSISITMASGSCITGFLIYRKGQVFPEADGSLFAGTAIVVNGDDIKIEQCAIFGFAQAIQTIDSDRFSAFGLKIDCLAGVWIDNSADITRLTNIHCWPFSTISTGTTASLKRTGIAYRMTTLNAWTKLLNCFAYGYATGFSLEGGGDRMSFTSCGADNTVDLDATIGFSITGANSLCEMIACKTAAQDTGYYINMTATYHLEMIGCDAWSCDSYGTLIEGGDVTINGGGYETMLYGIAVDSATANVIVDSVRFSSINFYTVSAINTANPNIVIGKMNEYGNMPDGHVAADPVLTTIPVIASAATINLPLNGDTFNISGTTNIQAINGIWPGRTVKLLFQDILTLLDGVANLQLAGNFVTAANSVIHLGQLGSGLAYWYEISRSTN